MSEWSGYCSHSPEIDCPNCKTYYIVPTKNSAQLLKNYAYLMLLETWVGREPKTSSEKEEVKGLKALIRDWKEQVTIGQAVMVENE